MRINLFFREYSLAVQRPVSQFQEKGTVDSSHELRSLPTVVVGGRVCLRRPPDSVLGGVAECVGWNERWKAEPWAQWESNQERSFLWIGPRPKRWRGPLCFRPEMKRQYGKARRVTATSLG